MAALLSTDFTIPAEISQGIFEKAQKGSTQHSYPEQDRRSSESSRYGC